MGLAKCLPLKQRDQALKNIRLELFFFLFRMVTQLESATSWLRQQASFNCAEKISEMEHQRHLVSACFLLNSPLIEYRPKGDTIFQSVRSQCNPHICRGSSYSLVQITNNRSLMYGNRGRGNIQ